MLFDRLCRKAVSHGLRGPVMHSARVVGTAMLLLLPLYGYLAPAASSAEPLVALPNPAAVPQPLLCATSLGRLSASKTVSVAVSLPWRNEGQLDSLVHSLGDRNDPLYKKYLTHQQFVSRFAPTQSDYDAVKTWANESGLSVQKTTSSRKLLVVSGAASSVESAFHVNLNSYRLATGRVVFANTAAPAIPRSIASRISAVVGLTDYTQYRPQYVLKNTANAALRPFIAGSPLAAAGNGPGGGVTPADIRTIYDISPLYSAGAQAGLDGSGQTIALYEQNGYVPSDITQYAKTFGLPDPVAGNTLQNIPIGNFNGVPTDPGTQVEVTLDIEMVLAVAPKANILVYEADDMAATGATISPLTILTQIVDDDKAQIVSVSYGVAETDANFGGMLAPENDLFKQMAAQGQSMLASSGDNGAYNKVANDPVAPNTDLISVIDPASQPLVTAVGGTSLNSDPIVNGIATYGTETTWNNSPLPDPVGGGGGESEFWTKPDYQIGQGSSATMRDIPDVSLNADPNTGYSIFIASQGPLTLGTVTGFDVVGGTSASCPLWAAFTALVNQQRQIFSLASVGFLNPDIYSIAEGPNYSKDFHDIADGSTNLLYVAVPGFDDATGWGTFIAANLLPEFAPTTFGSGDITVHVVGPRGNSVSGATVTVSTTQIKNFTTQAQTDDTGTATFTLPTGIHDYNNSGEDGVLTYTVSADYTNLAGEAVANQHPPAFVTLLVRAPDHVFAGGLISMISSPYDYSTVADFAQLFGLALPLSANGTTAQLYSYSPTLAAYLTYPTAPADTLRRGQGYWAVLPVNSYIRRFGVYAPTQAFRINLLPGWNMIGDPYTAEMSVSRVQVDTVKPGSPVGIGAATTVQLPFYSYDGSAYQAVGASGSLQPYQGYWIHATSPAVLVIPTL